MNPFGTIIANMCKTLSFQENIEGNVKLNLTAQPRLQVAGQ